MNCQFKIKNVPIVTSTIQLFSTQLTRTRDIGMGHLYWAQSKEGSHRQQVNKISCIPILYRYRFIITLNNLKFNIINITSLIST